MILYYRIWVDCIQRAQSLPQSKDNWKVNSIIFMSVAMSFNLLLLMTIIQRHWLNQYFYRITIDVASPVLNNIATYLILFLIPCVGVNYFFIFKDDKYKELKTRYQGFNGRLFITYIICSMLIPIVLIWYAVLS